jgi:hypothetical protein
MFKSNVQLEGLLLVRIIELDEECCLLLTALETTIARDEKPGFNTSTFRFPSSPSSFDHRW